MTITSVLDLKEYAINLSRFTRPDGGGVSSTLFDIIVFNNITDIKISSRGGGVLALIILGANLKSLETNLNDLLMTLNLGATNSRATCLVDFLNLIVYAGTIITCVVSMGCACGS